MLEITQDINGTAAIIHLNGRLDSTSAADFEKVINGLSEDTDAITLDFEKLRWLSSAGLRVILLAQKKLNPKKEQVRIERANELAMEILDSTGFTDIVTVIPAEGEAE